MTNRAGRTHWRPGCCRPRPPAPDPANRLVDLRGRRSPGPCWAGRRRRWSRCRLRSPGPRIPALRQHSPSACAVSWPGLHLALLAIGVGQRGDITVANSVLFRGRARLRRHRPGDAGPRRRARGDRPRAPSAPPPSCPCTSTAARPTSARSRATGCRSWRTRARRSAPSTPTGRRSGAAGTRRCSASTPTSSSPPARAAWSSPPTPTTRCASTPSATRAAPPDLGWLDHDRLGFNYRLSDIACAIGLVQLERLDGMLAGRARVADLYRQALAPLVAERGLELPCPDAGGDRRGWFVYVVGLPDDAEPPTRRWSRSAELRRAEQALHAGDPPHVLLPRALRAPPRRAAPVAEAVAARSLALPFFPEASARVRSRAWPRRSSASSSSTGAAP